MDWRISETDLSCIDTENSTYRISTDNSIEPLAASIGAVGLLTAPLVLAAGDRNYVVVSGFRRVAACRHLGHATIRARLLNPDMSPERLAEIAIGDNACQRPLNVLETSRALTLLVRYIEDPVKLDASCRRLGLPEHPSVRGKIMRVCQMPVDIQKALLDGTLSFNTARELDDMDRADGLPLAGLFRELQLSHSKQREIITNVVEIARRDKVSVGALLKDARFQTLVSDPDANRTQKAGMVRQYFRKKRFPFLSATEERFQQESRKLPLGNNIRLQAPQGFESSAYDFIVSVKNIAELEASVRTLQATLENPALKNILALKTT
jgi:ParB family chromosome partitioning protein